MNAKSKYDNAKFLTDRREDFKYLYNVAVGKFAPHITCEVDCKYLFSHPDHISHPNRSRTMVENFVRLVMEKHQIDSVYCFQWKVKMNSLNDRRVIIGILRKIKMILDFGTRRNIII